jgi:SagB-type dehydrogenase family enzyme
MRSRTLAAIALAAALLAPAAVRAADPIALPKPDIKGRMPLEQVIAARRSTREYAPGALTKAEVAQLMWAAQGVTSADGKKRAVPSARAVYPIQVWIAVFPPDASLRLDMKGLLPPGLYRYDPAAHALIEERAGDPRAALLAGAKQPAIEQAAAVVAVVGDSVLAAAKFGPNAARWLGMEAGFAVQNVYLEATALGLGTVMVGGFQPPVIHDALGLGDNWLPLGLMPIGRKK